MRTRRLFSLCGILVLGWIPTGSSANERGAEIYRNLCAECHGPKGQGIEGKAEDPLVGDRSLVSLAGRIERTMPEDEEDACVGPDARAVAEYIYDAFYSEAARQSAVRRDPARLTVPQDRASVADLAGSFRGGTWFPREERGATGHYHGTHKYGGKKENQGRDLFKRVDRVLRFDFGAGVPELPEGKTLAPQEFSIRWDAAITVPHTGVYEFVVRTRNGVMLWVNDNGSHGKQLIDGWVAPDNLVREVKGRIFLLGGRNYPVRLDFFKYKEAEASVELLWKPPHGVLETVPARVLSPEWHPRTLVVETPFPPDDRSAGYERGTAVSPQWFEAVTAAGMEAATRIVDQIDELAQTNPEDSGRETKLRNFAVTFAERAFRRPMSETGRKAFLARFFPDESSPLTAVKRGVLYALTSPRFLYPALAEGDDPHATAARLALALWDSVPDQHLLKLASQDQLRTREQVTAEAWRMLHDPRARAKLRGFFSDWLELDRAEDVTKDHETFPGFTPAVMADLHTSLHLFLEETLWGPSPDYRQLLLADHLYLNPRLAALYGAEPGPPGFRKVNLPHQQRAGVLTHPYLLTAFAYHDNTSPIHRGVFLTRNIVGLHLKPPPEAIEFEDGKFDPGLTMREKVTELTRTKACMACHSTINPLGFSLEHYDAIGRWRTLEKNRPINAASDFTDDSGRNVRLEGARDVARYAANTPAAHRAFILQLFDHIVKQPAAVHGVDTVDHLEEHFRTHDFNVQALIVEIAVRAALAQPDRAS